MAWTEAQVPLLDPATDKFPDRFAPPSVAADKLAAAASAAAALASEQTATTQAGTATTQAGIATTQAGTATTQAGISTTQAETAATQAGISTTQAETATTQAGLAQTAASNASISAGAANTSANTAVTQAGVATTQAGIATTKAGEASTSAGTATTKAGEASTSAGTATTKAGIATTQAGIATTQAETAATQAGIATTQAETATTQAGLAQTAASNASISAGAANTSAGTATTKAGIATTQAGIATTKAGEASTSAGTATTKAGEASTSAGTATAKAGEAAASAAAALTSEQNAAATLANAVTKTTYDAKGDLLVGTGADAYTCLPVGADGSIPVANSNAAGGIAYQSPVPLLVNLLTNSDFSQGTTGWFAGPTATISATAGVLSITGNGTDARPYVRQTMNTVGGNVYYRRIRARVTNASCLSIRTHDGLNTVSLVFAPSANVWYDLSVTYTGSTNSAVFLYHNYADAATANGKVMEVDSDVMIDLTACFGAGREPSLAEMDALMARWGGWFAKEDPKLLPSYDWQKLTQNACTNLVTNGDFSNGTTDWTAVGGSLTAANGVCTLTANGTNKNPYSLKSTNGFRLGQTIYVAATYRATNVAPNTIGPTAAGFSGLTVSPTLNTWYTTSAAGVVSTNGGALNFALSALYASPEAANGATFEHKNAILINLTTTFGAGNEPTKSEMDRLLSAYPNSWFNGTTNDLVTAWKLMRRYRSGTGSPEGVVTAPVGTEWIDTAVTCGVGKWLKTSATDATGWTPQGGDTGIRILTSWDAAGTITGAALPSGIAPTTGVAGSVRIRRVGSTVVYAIRGATWSAASTFTVPVGFRSATVQYRPATVIVSSAPTVTAATVGTSTLVIGASGQSAHATNATVVSWESEAWPTALPGA